MNKHDNAMCGGDGSGETAVNRMPAVKRSASIESIKSIESRLAAAISGEVCFDDLTRTLYATDASIYKIVPAGVVYPKTIADVQAIVRICTDAGVSVVARGAGTGLAGGAVGPGVQIDLSKHFQAIGPVDAASKSVTVGAGVVLDDLNRAVRGHGLQFAPDVATSSRATIGGMVAGNSCGAHSVIYGRMSEHIRSLTCVLADGSVVRWSHDGTVSYLADSDTKAADRILARLTSIRDRYRDEIVRRYPRILRRNGGYALDRLIDQSPVVDPATIVCGSEGTLCIVVEAELNLVPLPVAKAMALIEFGSIRDALAVVPAILEREPAAVELIDHMILEGARTRDPARYAAVFDRLPEAVLVVEHFGDSHADALSRCDRLLDDAKCVPADAVGRRLDDVRSQENVWHVRKSGLGLLMSRPGDDQPHAFVEDSSVDPNRLCEYVERFQQILQRHDVQRASYYAHASVGCLHVRPVLNLKRGDDIAKMVRIADDVAALVCEFGGSMSGEHGDGIVRSRSIERMFGPALMAAFAEVKTAFDPHGLMNPGKIVDPLPMDGNLRYGADHRDRPVKSYFDFKTYGGMGGLVGMCSGVGACRQRMTGTMCPSYMATGDEKHTTRARANALQSALAEGGLIEGLADPRLDEVMDLCLSCKACKSECPTGVDLARLKAEWLAHRNQRLGVTRRARFIADTPRLLHTASRLAPLSNWVMQSGVVRAWMERRYGLDRRVPPPRVVRTTFRAWYRRRRKKTKRGPCPRGRVAYWADCWTNHCRPEVGKSAVRVLEAAGYDVLAPGLQCCGRPHLSQGLLAEARMLAESNIRRLAALADMGVPVTGTEPSCVLSLIDEYPALFSGHDAKRVAAVTAPLETLVAQAVGSGDSNLAFEMRRRRVLFHGHCHQKALVGVDDVARALSAVPGQVVEMLAAGCCGMAGSFGHEVEHYDVARAIGEERLFPALRARGDATVAVSGFSCAEQVAHHVGIVPRHWIELLADGLSFDGS